MTIRSLSLSLLLIGAAGFAAAEDAGGPPGGDRGGDRRMQRMIEENPELKGVDPKTPEGEAKIREVMQKGMAKRMAEAQTANHAKIREGLAMSAEEFAAIEPLLSRVEQLQAQQRLVLPQNIGGMGMMGGMRGRGQGGPGQGGPGQGGQGNQGAPTGPGGQGGPGNQGGPGGGNFGEGMLKAILGDTPIDPSAKEAQDATKALKSLVADAQANATEVAAAMARLRKARAALATTLEKAQADLQGVLTPHQEAVLVDRGILE